jgi:hypothetical protein
MVSGISSISSSQYQSQVSKSNTLTDDQKETLQDILAKYDSDNMTADSMKEMMDEIKNAGIKPSKEFGQIMNDAGFKPPEKPQGPPPEDSTSSTSDSTTLPDYLQDFITKEESGTVNQSDIDSLIQSLKSSGKMTEGVLVDQKV